MLNFNYFADVKKTLYDEDYSHSLALMKQAGVSVLWLLIYNAGRYFAEKDEIIKAKGILESKGFEVNAITVPVGHPGNSLNPEEVLDLSIPDNWTYRVNAEGENVCFCACVNDALIKDNKEVVEFCRDAGFRKVFFDDDLRTANFGDEVCGCFCDACVNEFSKLQGKEYTREEIVKSYKEKGEIFEKWTDFNCSKITRFMKETAVEGIQTGIMLMIEGTREHGLDVKAIKQAVPNCLFRVGEWHFDDEYFENDVNHQREINAIKMHLKEIETINAAYSETTVFPPKALSPENLVEKAKLAISQGIENIFLMSGTWVMSDEYWLEFIKNRDALQTLSEKHKVN